MLGVAGDVMGKPGHWKASQLFPLKDKLCDQCGAKATDRHHIDGDPTHNVVENIQFLCRRCHMTLDGRLGRLKDRISRLNTDPEHQRRGGQIAGKQRAAGDRDELGRFV